MKIRTDFVSNSSSSSFIVLKSDLDKINVYGDAIYYSLKEYLDNLWYREIHGDYWYYDNSQEVKYVSTEDYLKEFPTGAVKILPISCKESYEEYSRIDQECISGIYEDLSRKEQLKLLKPAENKLVESLYNILKLKYDNEIFVDIHAEDYNGNEEAMTEEYYSQYDKLKFVRKISNH
jgi:hypothetical protein